MVEGGGWWRIKSESLEEKNKVVVAKKYVCQNHTEYFWHPPPSIHHQGRRPKRIHSRPFLILLQLCV